MNNIKTRVHITLDDRVNIQAAIAKNLSLAQTSIILSKSRSTIFREIVNNCTYKNGEKLCKTCLHSNECKYRMFYNKNFICNKFEYLSCNKWKTFPYTCNGCSKYGQCLNTKRVYDCKKAHDKALFNLSYSRTSCKLLNDSFEKLDETVSQLIKNGQSLWMIWNNNEWIKRICSLSTLKRAIYKGLFKAKAFELPCYTRYKKVNYSEKYQYARLKNEKIKHIDRLFGRTYSDFRKFVNANPKKLIWEYDSVEGKKYDKQDILTITLAKYRFQFGILIKKHNPVSVLDVMNWLKSIFKEKFQKIFEINLSDNGTEFDYFDQTEIDDNTGERICRVFFTNPYKATDKARCERNHRYIRRFTPKFESLEWMTQEDVNLMFSHINSTPRKSNKNKTPYELVLKDLGLDFLEKIGIKYINPNDVCLKPWIFKKNK